MQFPDLLNESPEPSVNFHFEDVEFDLPKGDAIETWLMSVSKIEGKAHGEVNIIFCSDEHLRQINVSYLDHDYYTDIITFPYDENSVYGDIFISSDRVRENAQNAKVSFEAELCRVMAHGILHLAGYDDQTPELKKAMSAKEDEHLKRCPIF
ncbi:MAG: rRNA maturation RNase YbeY [Saprospiraceae bacterium]|nr:rRNA maturation RNase YbeY [Saprospiraceae bacterium]